MTKFYQPVVCRKNSTKWEPVKHSGLNVYASDVEGAKQLLVMLHQMTMAFSDNEFKLVEVEIPNG